MNELGRRMRPEREYARTRKKRIDRVRTRLKQIRPEDGDMIEFRNVMQALCDIMADDGDDT